MYDAIFHSPYDLDHERNGQECELVEYLDADCCQCRVRFADGLVLDVSDDCICDAAEYRANRDAELLSARERRQKQIGQQQPLELN